MNERLSRLQIHPTVRLQAHREAVRARGQRMFDFGVGDPLEPTPPFVRQALIDSVPEYSDYPTVAGTEALRQAIARYVGERFGAELDPATEILPTAGSKEALFHLPMVLVNPSAERNLVVFGEPAYEAFRIGACFAGAEEHGIPLSAEGSYLFGPEDVGDEVLAKTAMVFLNYPHNPTGQDMPPELYRSWVEARDEHGFVLVSDECYCDLYLGEPPRSLLEFGRKGCLAAHTLSKRSGMTGYLSGFLAGDPELMAHLRRHRAGMGVTTPIWTQAAATAAWNDDEHVERVRTKLAEKHGVLVDLLEARGLEVYPGNGSLFLWARVPDGETDLSYADRLLESGIIVAPGTLFGKGQDHYIRVALSPSLEECHEVAAIWPA